MTIPAPRILAISVVSLAFLVACDDPGEATQADADLPSSPDAGLPPSGRLDVVSVSVTTPEGEPARKGRPLRIELTVLNPGKRSASASLIPYLTSRRFNDYNGAALPAVDVVVAAGEQSTVSLEVGPFIHGPSKRWALGAGEYSFDSIHVLGEGGEQIDTAFAGSAFQVAASNVVFTAVTYDPAYFAAIGWQGDIADYLHAAYTRPNEVFDPATGEYTSYPGGFDELLGIEQQFDIVAGLSASPAAGGFCEQIASHAQLAFGLTRTWDIDEGGGRYTDPDHHGYDVLVGLTPAMGGGAACGWLGVQVSSLFDFDLSLDRSQIVLVHESGHLFGAPHCDPEQGYVMCAGEQHPHYQESGVFVWHQSSVDAMRNPWAD